MNKDKGFTLVELLLYTSLIGMVVLATSVLLTVLQRQRIRSQVIGEVEAQGVAAMTIIGQTIRNSTAINSPGAGSSAGTISVNVPTAGLSPTVFGLSSGVIRITEGASPAVDLTSARVVVSGLTFSNLSRPSTLGTVRIVFTASYNNPDGLTEYTYSKTFITSATLR